MDDLTRVFSNFYDNINLLSLSAKDVKVGDHVSYAVPKPPDPTTYAHGIVKSIKTSGTVKVDGTNESFEATADNPIAIIEVWATDDNGDPVSKTDRRVAKPVSKLRVYDTPIDSAALKDTLKNMMEEYNKTAPEGRKVRLSTLQTVFNRGVGAYKTNPSSVRPNVRSADQWGYGRVKAFLKMLKSGSAPRKPFDQDLLPKEHPLSSKSNEEAQEKRIYFRVISEHPSCPASKPFGVIGEKSGVVHGCHATQASANNQLRSLYAATDPKSGYKPSKEDRKNLETPTQHEKRREREKKAGMASMDVDVEEGDIVKFMLDGKETTGRVEHVMLDGSYAYPGSRFYFEVTPDNPAVLIRIWDGSNETNLLTGLPYSDIEIMEDEDDDDEMPEETAANSYPIPDRVKKNAQRGLELRKKFGRGGTSVGENTARTLAAGGSIGIEKIRHINRYFPRHAGDNLSDKTSNGWIAWLLWGGDAAWSWTRRIIRSYEAQQKKENARDFTPEIDGARDFSPERRMKLAKEGLALPDGSYPIVTVGDLKNAIQAYGRAKDKQAAKMHIMKRARSLKAEDLLPENWN